MRVLVFGNSHAACLMEACREGGAAAGHEVAFFVRSGRGVADYALEAGRIRGLGEMGAFLDRLGLPQEQDLTGYDALAIMGSEMSLFAVVQVLNVYRILDWPQGRGADGRPAITEAVLRLALDEGLAAGAGGRLLADLRKVPELAGKPIHLLPQPFPSERLLAMGRGGAGAGVRRLLRERWAGLAAGAFHAGMGRLAARHGAIFHPQPPETVVQACLTAEACSTRARRLFDLDRFQPQEDILHANGRYGRLLLAQILAEAAD